MNSIFNRIVLLLGLTALILPAHSLQDAVIPLLAAIALSGFLEYFESTNLRLTVLLGYTILCMFFPLFTFYLPLIMYDVLLSKYQPVAFITIVPPVLHIDFFTPQQLVAIFLMIGVEIILKNRGLKTAELRSKYIEQQDDFTELSMELKQKISVLTERQDIEINFATLNERNRIAREIHDNVGHLLSSSILQIGALMAITKDEPAKKGLEAVKNTLDAGMDSIRKSVHNLHDDSVDLKAQMEKLTGDFTFCSIYLNYDVHSNLPAVIKYAVIAIAKEALANVIKHSNATEVNVGLLEHPMLLQLIIADNGTKINPSSHSGMGLESIRQRVLSLEGIINFNYSKGFKIFISIPKHKKD